MASLAVSIKSSIALKVIAYIVNAYIWLVFKTCKISIDIAAEAEQILSKQTQCILVFWHGRILPFPKLMARYNSFATVVSTHRDAEYLAQVLSMHGHKLIRGSSNKNSISAMMGMVKHIKSGDSIAITPDGPKGPRFKIKGVVLQIAEKYNLPIIPVSYSASHAKVFSSWDRFILPIPFKSKIEIKIEGPVLPQDLEQFMCAQIYDLDEKTDLKMDY
jgi:hypothetical protein